jgi:hypothetical protein
MRVDLCFDEGGSRSVRAVEGDGHPCLRWLLPHWPTRSRSTVDAADGLPLISRDHPLPGLCAGCGGCGVGALDWVFAQVGY